MNKWEERLSSLIKQIVLGKDYKKVYESAIERSPSLDKTRVCFELEELKSFISQELKKAREEAKIVHAVFWCNLCEKYIPREEVEGDAHATSTAVVFSHQHNHLLEVKEQSK